VQIGSYEELITSSSSFNLLLENIHQQEQEEQERSMKTERARSSRYLTFSQHETEEGLFMESQNFETKEEGSVKWHVYSEYLRAGVGLLLGTLLLITTFSFREATTIYYSWWLAEWSDDESHRHRHLNNCTQMVDQKITTIRSMNDTEWNTYRNSRFYYYCGW
jgi:hypothetical protein